MNGNYSTVDNTELNDLIEHTKQLLATLNPLEKGSSVEIEPNHIIDMLKQFSRQDDDILMLMHEAFIVGSTLHTMAIQFLLAKAVFRDPKQYSRILPMTAPGAKAFKENPSVKGMKQFLPHNVVEGKEECGRPQENKNKKRKKEMENETVV